MKKRRWPLNGESDGRKEAKHKWFAEFHSLINTISETRRNKWEGIVYIAASFPPLLTSTPLGNELRIMNSMIISVQSILLTWNKKAEQLNQDYNGSGWSQRADSRGDAYTQDEQ